MGLTSGLWGDNSACYETQERPFPKTHRSLLCGRAGLSQGSSDSPGTRCSFPGPSGSGRNRCCRFDTESDGGACAYLFKARYHRHCCQTLTPNIVIRRVWTDRADTACSLQQQFAELLLLRDTSGTEHTRKSCGTQGTLLGGRNFSDYQVLSAVSDQISGTKQNTYNPHGIRGDPLMNPWPPLCWQAPPWKHVMSDGGHALLIPRSLTVPFELRLTYLQKLPSAHGAQEVELWWLEWKPESSRREMPQQIFTWGE